MPIVDHATEREETLERFNRARRAQWNIDVLE
jgi:hypothetical protein